MDVIASTEVSGSAEVAENRVATAIIGAAIEVQRHLGPGLIESAYELALAHELQLSGWGVLQQVPLAAHYKGIDIPDAYRIDLIVEGLVVVEAKAIERLSMVHEAQVLTYLKFSNKRLGLLINFHSAPIKNGIRRVVNGL